MSDLILLANRRNEANIPKWRGHWVSPYCLPNRGDGEDILTYAKRAGEEDKNYLRDVVRWTAENAGIATNDFVRFAEKVLGRRL